LYDNTVEAKGNINPRRDADRGRTLRQLLDILRATVPDFVATVSAAIARE
jgi:hypothetical protein